MAMTLSEIMDLQARASTSVKSRRGGAFSSDDKAKYLTALAAVADGKSVQGAAEEAGVNQYNLYAFVKGKKKLDLLVDA